MLKIVLLAVAAIAVAGPAHAGPLAAAVAWVGATLKAGGIAAAMLRLGAGLALNLLASVLMKPQQPKVDVQFDVDMGDDTPLSFIAGEYPTAGKRKYIGSWGKNTRYITEVIEISSLPVTTLKAVWFNDELGNIAVTEPAMQNGHLMGYPVKNFSEGVGTGDERDRCWIKLINGSQTTADAFLVSIFGTDPDYPWTTNMIGTGKAYVVLTYYYDPEVMTSVPQVLIQPQPLPMYDIRKDSTAGGSGTHRWNDRTTYEPSVNPAVIAYNIARGIYLGSEWLFGGRNLPAWRLPSSEWIAAANECDAPVTLNGGGTEPAYRCGLQISVDMTPADALEEVGRAANMRFAEVGGMLKPVVGLPGAAVLGITDGDILITEGQSFKPFNSLGETFNALSATYPEPGEKWATKDAPEYIDAGSTAEDGGRYLPTSVAYPAAPFARQVQRLMRAQMRDYRRARVHQIYLPPDAYALEPLVDMISWSSQRNGYINKQFVVEEVAKTPGLNVLVTLREVDPSDYDWSSDFELPVTIVIPAPVRPWVQPINGFAALPVAVQGNDGSSRRAAIMARCDGDEVGVTDIHLQVRLTGGAVPTIDVKRPFSDPFQWLLHDVLPATGYEVRGRLLSELTARSAWTVWHTVTTYDVRLGREDIEAGIIADVDDLLGWMDDTITELDDIRSDMAAESARIDGIVQDVRDDLAGDVVSLQAQIAAGLASANGYTDTAIENHDLTIQGQFEAVAGQIEQLTAALTSENLITNGKFAADASAWTLTNAARVAKAGSTDALVLASPADAMVSIGTSSTGAIQQALGEFTVNADDRMQIRFSAASVAATRNLSLTFDWRDGADAPIGTPTVQTVTVSPENQWRVYSLQVDPPDTAVGAVLTIDKTQTGVRVLMTAIEATTVNIAIEARLTSLEAARVTDQAALATYKTEVNTRFSDADAALTAEQTARSSADAALGNRVTTVEANYATQQAIIEDHETAISTAEEAIAQVDQRIETTYGRTQLVRDPEFRFEFTHWQGANLATGRLAARDTASASGLLNSMPALRAFGFAWNADPAHSIHTVQYDVSPEEVFVLSAWFLQQSNAPTGRVYVQFFDATGAYLADGPSLYGSINVWRQLRTDPFQPPTAARKARVMVGKGPTAASANAVWITGITLQRQTGYDALTSSSIAEVKQAQVNQDSAFASFVSTMNSTVAGLDGRITTNANNIAERYTRAQTDNAISAAINSVTASLQPQINQRATTSALNALTARVSTAEGDITAVANSITSVQADVGNLSGNGLFRIGVTANPAGVSTRIGLRAIASIANQSHTSALFLEANTNGTSSVGIVANSFYITDSPAPGGVRTVPFYIKDGTTYIRVAMIENLTVGTLKLADGAVTAQYAAEVASFAVTHPDTSGMQDVLSLTFTLSQACIILLGWSYEAANTLSGTSGTVTGRVYLNATAMEFSEAKGNTNTGNENSARVLAKSLGAGTHTLKLRANYSGNSANKVIRNASIFLWRAYK